MPPTALQAGLRCACPSCGIGPLYKGFLTIAPTCTSCGLNLAAEDSGDGPAVFLIFALGFIIAPLAIWAGFVTDWPLWVHALLWGGVCVVATLLTIRPLKAFTVALQYKHRRQESGKL